MDLKDQDPRAAALLTGSDGEKLLALASELHASAVSEANVLGKVFSLARSRAERDVAVKAASMAWTIATERRKAIEKLGPIGSWILFDSVGLQMASSQVAAAYHADLVKRAGAEDVADMTAGIGVDMISFATSGVNTTAYESDPVRAIFAQRNAVLANALAPIDVLHADSLSAKLPHNSFVYADPPRRTGSSRWGNSEAAEEMIASIIRAQPKGALIKLSPAVDHAVAVRYDGQLEFLSVAGECKEALLRIGRIRCEWNQGASAVLLPSGARLTAQGNPPVARVTSPADARYLYEPDPAIIRAGLWRQLAAEHGMSVIENDIPYLVCTEPVSTPFATGYAVLGAMPYHRKTMQAWLDANDAGALIVKKRGVLDDPEQVKMQFRLRGNGTAILCLTRQAKRVWAIFLAKI